MGREGAHEDTVTGTRILVDAGLVPRFQIYLNRKGLGLIDEFFHDLGKLKVLETMREQEMPINIHCMTFGSAGVGLANHGYRIETEDMGSIPEWLIQSTQAHFGEPFNLATEAEVAMKVLNAPDGPIHPKEHWLWFFVDKRYDVFANVTTLHQNSKLGNLNRDTWSEILDRYVDNAPPALQTVFTATRHQVVERHFQSDSKKLYMGEEDLIEYCASCEIRKIQTTR